MILVTGPYRFSHGSTRQIRDGEARLPLGRFLRFGRLTSYSVVREELLRAAE